MTTRMRCCLQTRLSGADEDPPALLAAQYVVLGRLANPVDVGGVQLEVAALAPALVQGRGADAAGRGPHLLVERDELVRQAAGRLGALRGRLLRLGGDLGERAVAALFGLGQSRGDLLLL